MIYLDSSVALAQLFSEDRSLAIDVSEAELVSSRLLECKMWNRIHALGLARTRRRRARC